MFICLVSDTCFSSSIKQGNIHKILRKRVSNCDCLMCLLLCYHLFSVTLDRRLKTHISRMFQVKKKPAGHRLRNKGSLAGSQHRHTRTTKILMHTHFLCKISLKLSCCFCFFGQFPKKLPHERNVKSEVFLFYKTKN